jgi:hypothetical protein
MKYHHRNAYIFASYAAGIRISDLLQLNGKISMAHISSSKLRKQMIQLELNYQQKH